MSDLINMVGCTFIVTGASSGIGRATSVQLSQLGARVVIVGRNTVRLQTTLKQLEGSGHRIETLALDDYDTISQWLKGLAKEIGPIDGVVHSAGVQTTRPLRLFKSEVLKDIIDINVGAALALAKGFRQKGVAQKGGSLVFLSSVMGLVGQPGQSVYSASKGALIALTKSLALELASEGLRVNCVAPGLVKTEMSERMLEAMSDEQVAEVKKMHPLGLGCPDDVASAISYLLSNRARWITGSTLTVDGGYTAH